MQAPSRRNRRQHRARPNCYATSRTYRRQLHRRFNGNGQRLFAWGGVWEYSLMKDAIEKPTNKTKAMGCDASAVTDMRQYIPALFHKYAGHNCSVHQYGANQAKITVAIKISTRNTENRKNFPFRIRIPHQNVFNPVI